MRYTSALLVMLSCGIAVSPPARAADWRQGGKLLLTNGVSTLEGSAGGGIATWAFIAGNETEDGIGGTAHATAVRLADYDLESYGAAVGLFDRVELSWARQSFDTRKRGAALGLGRGFTFGQHVFGAKLRVAGDGVYAQSSLLPQIAIGVQHKRADERAILRAVGARHAAGTDFYVAATKLLLARSLLLNGTVRLTKANQTGLLGFGGDRRRGYSAQFEGSAAYLVSRRLAVGAEVRSRPDALRFAREDDIWDVFAAYAVSRNVSITVAWADLGSIATTKGQRGAVLQLQSGF